MKWPRRPVQFEANWHVPVFAWMDVAEKRIELNRVLALMAIGSAATSLLYHLVEWLVQ